MWERKINSADRLRFRDWPGLKADAVIPRKRGRVRVAENEDFVGDFVGEGSAGRGTPSPMSAIAADRDVQVSDFRHEF